jgi:alkaline phosphatase D
MASIGLALVSQPALAKPPITKGEDVAVLKDMSPYLIDKLMGSKAWPGPSLGTLTADPQYQKLVEQHDLKLAGGPMLGQMTGRSVTVWLRTAVPADVQVLVSPAELEPAPNAGPFENLRVATTQTKSAQDMVGKIKITGLSPKTQYVYQVRVDGQAVFPDERPRFTTYPAKGEPGRFKVAFGGCSRYIPKNEGIWKQIADRDPDAFLTLGDNVYIDTPRQFGKQRMHYYRRQLRPEYQYLTARTPIYAIWDDHDFGVNDEVGGLNPDKPKWKRRVWKVFKRNWNNPAYGGGQNAPGCWFDFRIGDVHFIMTDGRYYRDFDKGTMLGPTQRQWLLRTLRNSDATFKVLASGTLWTHHADKGGADSWWGVKEERNRIFDLIAEEQIPGVVLISGDRHRADVYKMQWAGDYPLYEFETAVLTNIHHHETREKAIFSYNKGHMFGMFSFDTDRPDPQFTYRVITDQEEVVYEKTLRLSTLSP